MMDMDEVDRVDLQQTKRLAQRLLSVRGGPGPDLRDQEQLVAAFGHQVTEGLFGVAVDPRSIDVGYTAVENLAEDLDGFLRPNGALADGGRAEDESIKKEGKSRTVLPVALLPSRPPVSSGWQDDAIGPKSLVGCDRVSSTVTRS